MNLRDPSLDSRAPVAGGSPQLCIRIARTHGPYRCSPAFAAVPPARTDILFDAVNCDQA